MSDKKGKQATQNTSTILGVLKTAAFFGVFIGLGWFLLEYSTYTVPKEKDLKDSYKEISFNDLSDYDYYTPIGDEKVDKEQLAKNKIPDEVKVLNGKKVSLSGYMLPIETDDEGKVTQFNLNGNFDMCFYGAPVMLNQWIAVRMKQGKKVPYTHLPITVYGTLEVGEELKDGAVMSIYRMTPDSVATRSGTVK